ncbi:SGNH/GDSL hydrolase family protein [Pseudomonas nitroreducens]|uniref:SGNH/GDSL hydrolase family protein n=1 Tax=Pseudomonas nitroreducens TaxID=46680 RepID=UPI001474918C|nr:SGNH/GDSL hydrolase family protein [Pseudomonas nitroreducens]MDG9853240.1 SGNH/GDSL hydrolase family protein [Pseudomonas nitroreducens]MDH1072990.1 SGNH/GDSL hydrolase family protein [Pseudomonas nitroreducens]NMZ75238.1 SGNH/GDSL hydrolase family protein [Pseudomonas nitroreducens]
MSRWAGLMWWAAALPLLPLALPMAVRTRRTALRLAPAAGVCEGVAGAEFPGEPFRLLLLGESTVAGVGASCLDFALAGRLALALSSRLERPVAWRAVGENGITAAEACERLLPVATDQDYELVALVFGVNDTTHFSSGQHWLGALEQLIAHFRGRGARVVCTAVPPLQHFTALPWLLRQLIGWRAALLDRQLRSLALAQGAGYCGVSLEMQPQFLAIDGYHPSALGYQVWGEHLAQWLVFQDRTLL